MRSAMTRTTVACGLMLATGLLVGCQAQKEEAPVPTMSINDLMITVVTPATDTLWGIEDPQSDEEWQVYIDAAPARPSRSAEPDQKTTNAPPIRPGRRLQTS